jgi:hypothetical protein
MHTIGSIRSASGIMSKIASITAGFCNANDYMNNTGAGIDQDASKRSHLQSIISITESSSESIDLCNLASALA